MAISPVSFGSTYRVYSSENDYEKMRDLELFSFDLKEYDPNTEQFEAFTSFDMYHVIAVDDSTDDYIEHFLYTNGINFHRMNTEELFSEGSIRSRLQLPQHNKKNYKNRPVDVKAEAFDKAFKESSSGQYLGDYESMKQPERYDNFIKYIKSGEDIDVPEVYVKDTGNKPEIAFQDGTHRYAVFRDMGFKTIPVAMNEESYAVAQKYGLV